MAIHTFEDAMERFDDLLGELDANIRREVLEEIAERATTAMGDAARARLATALDDEEVDEDELDEDDDDFDDDDDIDDADDADDDDEDKPS
jgi:hypothetical protein